MSLRRSMALVVLAAAFAGCHDEEFVTVVSAPPTGFTASSSATGLTGFDEAIAASDVGGDGLPRLVFLRDYGTTEEILFTRRTSAGTWTAPLPLSANDAEAKTSVFAFVTASNDFTHVFWMEGAGAVQEVHYARVNNADPPALDTGGSDAVISGTIFGTQVPLPATVTALTAAVDRATHTVFAMWIEQFPSTTPPNYAPVVGEVAAAGPAFGGRTALVTPSATGTASASAPLLRVSPSGVAHAAWVGTDPAGANSLLRYSRRASAATWSASPGETVSDTAGNTVAQADLLLAGDGDVYAVWLDGTAGDILADYRASAGAFGTDSTVYASAPASTQVRAALESTSQILHVIWREGTVPGPVSFMAQRQSAADLGGTWLATDETLFSVTTAAGNSIDFAAWADSTDRVVVAYQAPPAAGDLSRTRLQIHTTGAATFNAAIDLTASFVLPCSALSVGTNLSGSAILVWEQGNGDSLPLSDVIGLVYANGGTVGGATNISGSVSTGSRAPFSLQMTASNLGHVFWHETTAVALRDIHYARTQ